MIHLNRKLCNFEGCTKNGSFNYIGKKEKLFCSDHKKDGMIYLNKKLCISQDCNKNASFNYFGEKRKLFCSEHKKEGRNDNFNRKIL